MSIREATPQDDQRALALAGCAWAFLDAESRGIGPEAMAALTVFQASWSQWSDSVLLGSTDIADATLRLGSWDVNTRNALRAALGAMLQSAGGGFRSGSEANAVLDPMPRDQPPSTVRGVWFVTELAMRFPERSTDPIVRALWSCARAVRGAGTEAGDRLSQLTFQIAEGVPAQSSAPTVVRNANGNGSAIIAAGTSQVPAMIRDTAVRTVTPPDADAFQITGRAPRPSGEVPWGPIIIGSGVLLLGGILTAAYLRKAGTGRRRRRGLRGLGYLLQSSTPNPLLEAEEQSRW